MADEIEWTPVKVRLGDLSHWADNPVTLTKAQAGKLLRSKEKLGKMQTLAIGPSNGDGKHPLYDGHQRANVWGAAFGMGLEVWALQSSRALTDDERHAVPIMLRTAVGSLDWDALAGWTDYPISEWGLDDDALQGLKFDIAALGNLLESETPETADAEPQIDRAEELNEKWQVKAGDLWRIGEHWLLCGDSTRREDVERVMQGEKAQLVVTSPPYGVGKDYEHGGIDEWLQLIRGCFYCCAIIAPTWFVNLANRRTGNNGYEANTFALMEHEFDSLGVKLVSLRIWVKQPAWSSSNPYWTQTYKPVDDFEFLGTFAKEKPKFKKRLTDAEYRDWGWRGIWEVASVRQNDIHSAMFPVELPSRAVKLLTDDGGTIYDPFVGSGTTIVACQNLGRKCRAIEISPAYCAVTLERMATAFPGIEIERIE